MSEVTRDEFAMLRDQVNNNAKRLDEIDRSGTRGVGVLAVQVQELTKDVGQVESQLQAHRRDHEVESRARVVSRRWAIGIAVALFAALESPLVTLLVTHR